MTRRTAVCRRVALRAASVAFGALLLGSVGIENGFAADLPVSDYKARPLKAVTEVDVAPRRVHHRHWGCSDRYSCFALYGAYGPYGGPGYWGAYTAWLR